MEDVQRLLWTPRIKVLSTCLSDSGVSESHLDEKQGQTF